MCIQYNFFDFPCSFFLGSACLGEIYMYVCVYNAPSTFHVCFFFDGANVCALYYHFSTSRAVFFLYNMCIQHNLFDFSVPHFFMLCAYVCVSNTATSTFRALFLYIACLCIQYHHSSTQARGERAVVKRAHALIRDHGDILRLKKRDHTPDGMYVCIYICMYVLVCMFVCMYTMIDYININIIQSRR